MDSKMVRLPCWELLGWNHEEEEKARMDLPACSVYSVFRSLPTLYTVLTKSVV